MIVYITTMENKWSELFRNESQPVSLDNIIAKKKTY